MLTVDVYNTKGEKSGKLRLPKAVFGAKVNAPLMAQAVRVYLANQRQAPAKTKHRDEVAYSTRKLYRQKGTGRARHGAKSAPIFVKGGVTHGPEGVENFKLKLSQKMRRAALYSALSDKFKAKEIMVVTGLEKLTGKTRELAKLIQNLKSKSQAGHSEKKSKISLILPEILENVIQGGRNITCLNLYQAKQLNTYEVLNGGILIFTRESTDVLKKF